MSPTDARAHERGHAPSSYHPPAALVLAGGGALGAYEAGVLSYALDSLERELGPRAAFDLFCGTSVGALNATFLAAAADQPAQAARALRRYWEGLTFNQVLRFGGRELTSLAGLLFGRLSTKAVNRPRPYKGPHPPVAGLFDTTPLYRQMSALIPWAQLQHNLATGVVGGVALCATEICSGMSTIFYQTGEGFSYRHGRDVLKAARPVTLTVDHLMASSAMPFFFPAIQVDGVCYTDGALRQNTPLNPALRMGAERILVVSLTQEPTAESREARLGCRRSAYPGALFLLGRTVRVMLSQTLDYELGRVEMYNRLLEGGCEHYGPGFLEAFNAIMGGYRNAVYRPIRTCHIRPSQSLLGMARAALRKAPQELSFPGLSGRTLAWLLSSTALAESEILALMLFTPTFIHALLELGYRDARAHHDELVALFVD